MGRAEGYKGGAHAISRKVNIDMFRKAKRISTLPPYLFAEIDRKKREVQARGVDLIDLGIGDPDIPTPGRIIAKIAEAASRPENHRYPSSSGLLKFRESGGPLVICENGGRPVMSSRGLVMVTTWVEVCDSLLSMS